MLFNSIEFAVFLPVVFLIYWFITQKQLKIQNLFLVVASYFFYGWWDWRFLGLIAFSSFVDFFVGLGLQKQENELKRKFMLGISLAINLGLLGFFKYFNFFTENLAHAFTFLGHPINTTRLHIILPVGISFYTFQTLSYSIDAYRRKIEPTKDMIAFLAFVSFFPQLVAGPIERATNLLPQFYQKRTFNYGQAVDGMRQILWGLFKKIVIADNCARFVNDIFGHYSTYSGSTLLLGGILFAFQIYGDFSGYSDIAIGTARLFGFSLMQNFAFPYFSRDIAEFWRRWHISLSTWFRDYLYIPLGGSHGNKWMKIRNTFIIFLVSGFWHGANWTFVAWGFLNALYILPLMISNKNRNHLDIVAKGRIFPNLKEALQIILTFLLTVLAWIFFRAESISQAFNYLSRLFSKSLLSRPEVFPVPLLITIVLFMMMEWMNRNEQHALVFKSKLVLKPVRWAFYLGLLLVIFFMGNFSSGYEFIYFQF